MHVLAVEHRNDVKSIIDQYRCGESALSTAANAERYSA
jgi:hypothetical protein